MIAIDVNDKKKLPFSLSLHFFGQLTKIIYNCLYFESLICSKCCFVRKRLTLTKHHTSYTPSFTLFANTASCTTQWKIWAHNSRNIVHTHWAITRIYMGKNNTLFAYKGTGNSFAALRLTTTHAPVLVPGSWFLVLCSWFLVPCSWPMVPGAWILVPGSHFLDLGS